MNEYEMQDLLLDLLGYQNADRLDELEEAHARTFEDAGIMTYNKGLVIYMPDGTEFQLTIVQSR